MSQQQLIDTFQQHIPTLAAELSDLPAITNLETYAAFPREQLLQAVTAAMQVLTRDLREGGEQHSRDHWIRIAALRAEQHANIEDLLFINVVSVDVFKRFVFERFADDPALCIWWLERVHRIVFAQVQALTGVFIEVREQMIQRQHEQIRELSTPIIPLHMGVLVLPIVGAVTSYRAGQIMEALLTGITTHQADVVIIDITGVPVVDTGVANYLLQTTRAARLLGATVVLVGIGAEIAQTIVQLGLDLADIVTRANLQSGIEYALARQGLAIQALTHQRENRS